MGLTEGHWFEDEYFLSERQLERAIEDERTAYERGLMDGGVKFKWISVKDRLPEQYQYVLVTFSNGEMVVACVFDFDEDIVFWRAQIDMGWKTDMDFEPSYWMPLPDAPKEE